MLVGPEPDGQTVRYLGGYVQHALHPNKGCPGAAVSFLDLLFYLHRNPPQLVPRSMQRVVDYASAVLWIICAHVRIVCGNCGRRGVTSLRTEARRGRDPSW